MPIRAQAFERKLRGGAQAHLIRADDGNLYAVKFRNNGQHPRILINEWLAHAVFRHLRIATAPVTFIDLTAEFIAAHPMVYASIGNVATPPEPGWHFASRFPGDPATFAIYDFLPDKLLADLANLHDFHGALVADRWLSNADARQAVFFRSKIRQFAPSVAAHGSRIGFVAMMIDHGYAFNGPEWNFLSAPAFGAYPRSAVYQRVTGWASFEPWLEQVKYFPDTVLAAARRELPPAWIGSDDDALDALLEKLLRRRRDVADSLDAFRAWRGNPFPNWR
jgi:hypothetical protein